MQGFIEIIRKLVVVILLMELVLQLQSGKNYEPYLKMLVGMMMTYTLVVSILGLFRNVDSNFLHIKDFEWIGKWEVEGTGNELDEKIDNQGVSIGDIVIPDIKIEHIDVERIGVSS